MKYFSVEENQTFAPCRFDSVRGFLQSALLALLVWLVCGVAFAVSVAPRPPDPGPTPVSATLSLQSGLQPGAKGRNRIPVNRNDPAFTVERLDMSPAIYLDVVMSDGTRSGPHAYLKDFASNIVFDTTSGDPNRLLKIIYWDVVRNDPQHGKYAAQLTSTGNGVGVAYLRVSFRNAPGVTASVPVEIVGSSPMQQPQAQLPMQQQVPQLPIQQQAPPPQMQAASQDPVENYWYRIVNRNSGKVLDVTSASALDGANVQQWSYAGSGSPQQHWMLVSVGGGFFRIENQRSGKVLDVLQARSTNGANVQQWSYGGPNAWNQHWKLIEAGDGTYNLQNRNSGKVLSVAGADKENGANVYQWEYTGRITTEQLWRFDPVR